jgi:hypothetical protein
MMSVSLPSGGRPHEVSRLIIGGNPVYGYSHFN